MPTTILLVLVVTLAVGAITTRSYNRSRQVVGDRQHQVVYNAATPALDRAKAKLEYLFQRDPRFPSGLPGELTLNSLLTDGEELLSDIQDAYTFPDETRIDINEDGTTDASWRYRVDSDSNGSDDATVAYSIIFGTPSDPDLMVDSSDTAIQTRANALQVRHAPLSGASNLNEACQFEDGESGLPIEQGWFQDPTHSAILRKNFQVNAYVLPDNPQQVVSTLEFHQDRQMGRGNRWGAWFRNDLEIFPGPKFNWNGAMHTEGNFVVGNKNFNGYLVSSPFSCLYSRDTSEITVADVHESEDENIPAFQGQIMSGKVNKNSFGSTRSDKSRFHLFDESVPVVNGNRTRLNLNNDSVVNSGPRPGDYALDPVALVTQDISQSRRVSGGDPAPHRDPEWDEKSPFVEEGRLINRSEDPPYVDDFFRADNRYGPKPRYTDKLIPGKIGEPITGDRLAANGLNDNALTRLVTNDTIGDDAYGLDGYWERRAKAEGLRLIVGQRLELGDRFGWGQDLDGNGTLDNYDDNYDGTDAGDDLDSFAEERQAESLYPADACPTSRCHETLQRRTLRDNLAAVQSLVVYHQASQEGDRGNFPLACYALTAHPGTAHTINASRTFAEAAYGSGIDIDFLQGQGVNGWEFEPPASSEANFAQAIALDQPLGRALRNLAHFAGDPKGGAPSFPPFQDDQMHPYPYLTMWGDFSVLRRILAMLDKESYNEGNPYGNPGAPNAPVSTTIRYDDLSLADQSTLHSAACTLGMLAYNLNLSIQEATQAVVGMKGFLTSSGQQLAQLLDSNPNNGDINDIYLQQTFPGGDPNPYYDSAYSKAQDAYDAWVDPNPNTVIPDVENPGSYVCNVGDDATRFDYDCDIGEYASQFSLDQFIAAFRFSLSAGQQDKAETLKSVADTLLNSYQVLRDRALGFQVGNVPNILDGSDAIAWDISTGYAGKTNLSGGAKASLKTGCDPNLFSMLAGGSSGASDRDAIVLSVMMCSQPLQVRYPSLHYLFPAYAHNHLGRQPNASEWNGSVSVNEVSWDDQPLEEEYIGNSYAFDDGAGTGVNDDYIYSVLQDGNHDGIENNGEDGIGEVMLQPRSLNLSDWTVPTQNSGKNEIYDGSGNTLASVSFLDKGIFNGREMMSLRVLDLDLELLRTHTQSLGQNLDGTGTDHWFPDSGIMYAFREDAVREDTILRPYGVAGDTATAWVTCGQNATFENTSGPSNGQCRMEANPTQLQDPPLNSGNAISPKSVDYYADPSRRPHGFRLLNGATLDRGNSNPRGLSFISDQPIYVQGAFNLHQTHSCNGSESCRLEEFKTKLNTGTYGNFYTRDNLDSRFAKPETDLWRTSEFLADAVTIISKNFCDGSIEDTFTTTGLGSSAQISSSQNTDYDCSNNSRRTSYLTQNRPNDASAQWQREDPLDSTSPILVSRNGHPVLTNGTEYPATAYYRFRDSKPRIPEATQRVNAIIISGLVPSRKDQSYGGLHNFPRFIGQWPTLHISGALLQLNFSNYATAPFDQDAWETNENANSSREDIKYYGAPTRRWGYDVGLQYVAAGPIAQRFVSAQNIRSEFYSEPPANDPYMVNLCRQISDTPETRCQSS